MSTNSRVALMASLLVASCASVTPGVRALPPEEFMAPCQEPAGGPKTNGELARYSLALRDALRGCNRQLDGIREWAASQ